MAEVNQVKDSKHEAKEYVSEKQVPQLFESITAGLLHHRPENPIEFVQECLENARDKPDLVRWNTFIDYKPSDRCRSSTSLRSSSSRAMSLRNESPFMKDHKIPNLPPSKKDIEDSLNRGYRSYTVTPVDYDDYVDELY